MRPIQLLCALVLVALSVLLPAASPTSVSAGSVGLTAAGGPGSAPAARSIASGIAARQADDDDDDGSFDEEGDSLDDFVDEVEEAANAYWRDIFGERGQRYRAPGLVRAASDERIRSKCGNSRGANHSYCPSDERVFLDWDSDDETSISNLWEDERYFVIVTTMGHEWGHHVQHLLGVFDRPDADRKSVEHENQADCLMGMFAQAYEKTSDWVTRADLRDAIADTVESGDDPDTPISERSHGTPDQRVEAFLRGYRAQSLAACGL